MECRVCESIDNTRHYWNKHMTMCYACAKETLDKMGRGSFDTLYWGGTNYMDIPDQVRREFYSDYLMSTHTFDEYVRATTEDE